MSRLAAVLILLFGRHGAAQDTGIARYAALILEHVNIVDVEGGPTKPDMSVVITGDRITAIIPTGNHSVPRNARVIDARGMFVIPGLADMHNHLGDGSENAYRRNLAEMLRWGVTTVFTPGHSQPDLSTYTRIRHAAAQSSAAWPRVYGVGRSISVKGGHASQYAAFLPETPDEIPKIIAELKAAGADAIKFIYDDLSHAGFKPVPVMRREVMLAVVRESHRAGLKAYAHAPQLHFAKEVLRAGGDGLVHAVCDAPVDNEFIQLMKQNDALYITTHSLRRAFADLPGWIAALEQLDEKYNIDKSVYEQWKRRKTAATAARQQLTNQKENVRRVFDAGLLVVAGTDTGVGGVLPGVSSQMELVVLVEDGLTPREALRTATVNAAKMLGREGDFGSVTVGKVADLVVLDKDPLQDIRNITRIRYVIKGGTLYAPSTLSPGASRQVRRTQDSGIAAERPTGAVAEPQHSRLPRRAGIAQTRTFRRSIPRGWDDWEMKTFDSLAAHGQKVFRSQGCAECHTPLLYTNNKITPAVGFTVPAEHTSKYDILPVVVGTDLYLAMKTRRGTGYYKVPSLKGVWYRGPFGHDGAVATLEEWFDPRRLQDDYEPSGFRHFGRKRRAVKGHEYGLRLSDADKAALLAFLRTL